MNEQQREKLEARLAALHSQADFRKLLEVSLYGEGELPGYRSELRGYLLKELQSEDAADELLSTLSKDLLQGLPLFRGESTLRTWIYTSLRRLLVKHRREQAQHAVLIHVVSSSQSGEGVRASRIPDEAPGPGSILSDADKKEKFYALFAQLSETEQQLLEMILVRKMSHLDIAAAMSAALQKKVNPEMVRKRFQRAKERLEQLARQAGYL